MRQVNDNIIPVQSAATITTAAIDSRNLFSCSVQAAATGAAGGTLSLQASNDIAGQDGFPGSPSNWSEIATVSVTSSGAFMIPKTDLCYQQLRLVYTNSGSGTISVVFKALGV